jgi:peptide-methionine (R)-S-oxide reductase
MRSTLLIFFLLITASACAQKRAEHTMTTETATGKNPYSLAGYPKATDRVVRTEEEWKKILTPEQYEILREEGTERSCSGKLLNNHEKGIYTCGACGNPLFISGAKFESGTGWPSFFQPIEPGRVLEREDNSYGMKRVEVLCARCESHLGHVFEDGPKPTGLRYCMNSLALGFDKKE